MNESIEFGTDGIRGDASLFPFTPQALRRLGFVIGLWMQKKYRRDDSKLLIGSDTRISCPQIKEYLLQGLASFPIHVVDAGIVPTPALFQLIHYNESFDCGIMISASHNPYQDNGIKLFDARRGKLNQEDELFISESFASLQITQVSDVCMTREFWDDGQEKYLDVVRSFFEVDFLHGLKIVLDCAHGATYRFAPAIFEFFGAEVICIGNKPDGKNINDGYGALHVNHLQDEVCRNQADIGFAFDGDGDRIMVVTRNGDVRDGDDILCMLMQLPEYGAQSALVGTVMTNSGLEYIIREQGRSLLRTCVGDKYVAAKMEEHNLLIGGETSGHIIIKDYLSGGDGIFVALSVVRALQVTNNWDMKTFDKMPQVLLNVPIARKRDLSQFPYSEIIDRYREAIGRGRVLVRYSGTENVLRIMTEAPGEELAHSCARALAAELRGVLQ